MAQLNRRSRRIAGPTLANGLPTFQGLGIEAGTRNEERGTRLNLEPKASNLEPAAMQETWKEKQEREALTNPPAPFQETWIEKRDRERASGIAGNVPGLANGGAIFDHRRTQSDYVVAKVNPVGPAVKDEVYRQAAQVEPDASQGGYRNDDGSWSAEAPVQKADPGARDFRKRLGLANGGGIAGLIPGKVNRKVADDVTIDAKIGEYIIPQEVVEAIGKDKFDQLVLEVKKSLGLPVEVGPKRRDQPDSLGRMNKKGLKGIADVPGLASGGALYGDELGNLTRSRPMTLVENYGMPRNMPAGQIPYTGGGQPVGPPSGVSRPAIPTGTPSATQVPVNPRNLPAVRPSTTPALKAIAGDLTPNPARGFTMGAEGATVSPARPAKQILHLANKAAEPLEQITSDQVKTNLGRAKSALTKGAEYVTPQNAVKTVGKGVLRGIAGGIATDMLLPEKANDFDDVAAIKKFTEKKQGIAGMQMLPSHRANAGTHRITSLPPPSTPASPKPKIAPGMQSIAQLATNVGLPATGSSIGTSTGGPSIQLDGNKGLGDTTAISNRVDWSPGSANVRNLTADAKYNDEVAQANRINSVWQGPKTAEQTLLAAQSNNTTWSKSPAEQAGIANANFGAQEKALADNREITGRQGIADIDFQGRKYAADAGLAAHGVTADAQVKAAEIGALGREAAARATHAEDQNKENKKDFKDLSTNYFNQFSKLNLPHDVSGRITDIAKDYAMAADPSNNLSLNFMRGSNRGGFLADKGLVAVGLQRYAARGYNLDDPRHYDAALSSVYADLLKSGKAKQVPNMYAFTDRTTADRQNANVLPTIPQ